MTNLELHGDILRILDSDSSVVEVSFEFPIQQAVRCGEVIVVLVESPPGVRHNRNVYGISLAGELQWQVDEPDTVHEDSPFTNVTFEYGAVSCYNWGGGNLRSIQ